MTTDSSVGVIDQAAAGSASTKAIDVAALTSATGATVYRQTVTLGDPTTIGAVLTISQPLGSSYAASVRLEHAEQLTTLIAIARDVLTELQNAVRLLGGQPST